MDARSSFSVDPAAYATSRPAYPAALFDWIASCCSSRRTAWDCATGNGQAATSLAERFETVEATDISAEQLAHGFHAANLRYSAQPAERTDFEVARFDLVAVAQALHWFDHDRFWNEVRRVAIPGAFFCAWGYSWFTTDPDLPELDPLFALLQPYWAPQNRLLWDGYQSEDIGFPFERVQVPAFSIELEWSVADVLNYLRTWSAYKRAVSDGRVAGSIARLETIALERLAARTPLVLTMPVTIVAGQVR